MGQIKDLCLPLATHLECHKTNYQSMLALAKKINYVAYDPVTCFCQFVNGITDPLIAQAKLSLDVKWNQYSNNFDVIVEYLMNQVSH